MEHISIVINEKRNSSAEGWLCQTGENAFRPTVIVCPGGGYRTLADNEGEPVALGYLKAGYHVFVLHYSIGKERKWPNPLLDYDQLMAVLTQNREKWHIDTSRIAVVGFSAGGHLAASAAEYAKIKPSAAILGYPGIGKELVDEMGIGDMYPIRAVTEDLCPFFIFIGDDDCLVNPLYILQFETNLMKHHIPFESHIYAHAQHGFGTATRKQLPNLCSRVPRWQQDSIDWLDEQWGVITENGTYTLPSHPNHTRYTDPFFFSTDCLLSELFSRENRETVRTMVAPAEGFIRDFKKSFGSDFADILLKNCSLGDILDLAGVPLTEIEKINRMLHHIKKP